MKAWVSGCALALAILDASASAHHSIAAAYDSSRPAAVEGVVAAIRFVNPHPFIMVDVLTNGAAEQWTLEMDNRRELEQIGFRADTLRPGDRVAASGSLSRHQARSLYLRELQRPADGFTYEQVGSSPRIRFVPAARK